MGCRLGTGGLSESWVGMSMEWLKAGMSDVRARWGPWSALTTETGRGAIR